MGLREECLRAYRREERINRNKRKFENIKWGKHAVKQFEIDFGMKPDRTKLKSRYNLTIEKDGLIFKVALRPQTSGATYDLMLFCTGCGTYITKKQLHWYTKAEIGQVLETYKGILCKKCQNVQKEKVASSIF